MNKDFQDSFMGGNNSQEAEEQLNSNFGDGGLDDTFEGDPSSNSFESRFSNDDLDDSFDGGYGDFNNEPVKESKFGIAKGIVGALIATKFFSIIDKNGSISRLLGINTGMGPQQQGQMAQESNNGGQQAQTSNQNVGQKLSGEGGVLSGLLSIVMILIGVGIILVFTFYVISFFLHDNLRPNEDITGTNDSSDLSPWVDRLTGKRNTELKILPSTDTTEVLPYRYDKNDELLYIYLEDNVSTMPFGKEEMKRYKIDKLEDSGYMNVIYTKNSKGEVTNVDPLSVYTGDGKTESNKDEYVEEDELKGLGLTKKEYRRIKELMGQGMMSGWFKKKSDVKPGLNNIDDLTERLNNDNKETRIDSNYTPQQSNVGGGGYVPQQAGNSSNYTPQQSQSGVGGGSQLQQFAKDEIIVKPAGEGALDPEETEKARQEALNRSTEDELARLNAQYEEERQKEKVESEKQKRLQELTDKGDQEYKDRLIREKVERQRREELEKLENENKTTESNKNTNSKKQIIVKEAGQDKPEKRKQIIPAEPDRTGTDRLIPRYK